MPKAKIVLKKPVITEKANDALAWGGYTFEVDLKANKKDIAQAIQAAFSVKVTKVRTITNAKKGTKKAIVQLKEGDKIDFFATGE